MTRILAFVATTGLIGAVVFLTLGVALAGRDWNATARLWNIGGQGTCGPDTSKTKQITLPFHASDRVVIGVPASVHYQPGDKAEAVISGDSAVLDRLRIDNGRITIDCEPGWFSSQLEIRLSGPSIERWELLGSGDLTLSEIDQPKLDLIIRGSGDINATGTADKVDLSISGSGKARMKDLTSKSAEVQIRGSGDARLTAQVDADVSISGSGDVTLFGQPAMRRSEVRGSGNIKLMP